MSSSLLQQLFDDDTPISNFKKTLAEIEESTIYSQAYVLFSQHGKLEKTPIFFQQALYNHYQTNLYQNIFLKSQMNQMLQLFEELRIDVIPLKGTMFAEKYYHHLGARSTSDIDLLVKEADVEKAIHAVKKLGYTIEESRIPFHFHVNYSKWIPGSDIPIMVELHWNLVKEKTANFQIEEIWNNSTTLEGFKHIKKLSDLDLFYVICLHGWRHNLESLKYFIDIIQLILQLGKKIDYEKLLEMATQHQTKKRILRTLSIVYEAYPALNQIQPLSCKVKTLFHHRTTKLQKYMNHFDYLFLSYDSPKHGFIALYHEFYLQYLW